MKIMTVVGARPQFIKAAVISRAIRAVNATDMQPPVEEFLVHTGQHYDLNMSDVFFDEMEGLAAPRHHLGIGNLAQGAMTGRMLEAIEKVILQDQPDCVVVYGDTNSTLAGALAAVKLHVPVAHVEAGLRSFNRRMPEEINRVLTDHASSILFAPTDTAVRNLASEGLPADRVHLVGDVMYDATLAYGRIAEDRSRILETLHLRPRDYILATIHRAENTDDPARLEHVCRGLSELARSSRVVFPVHPRTKAALKRAGSPGDGLTALTLCDPLGYLDMTMLEKHARVIVTDSGGVQKEAYFHRVPCITVREETEWRELVDLGWNRVTPPAEFAAPGAAMKWATDRANRLDQDTIYPYGRGDAANRIVGILLRAPGAR